ncbi:flavin-nucleotide-binding protein [Mycobacterium bohemicum DSM 44277]|uniref:Flavin-nucleotide-binding protein n=2 Tax=Mycobacterium bohemicum TaxID=56425 RepID=A0A1X1R6L5_MYCBE|nr:pyridoxamine 5'-phosphate oxidase family protein [Mycobacterium bohemicum]MCV6969536.1 pyridoxamine 5'-phosphate oxidase family protein [Mycobacterium bohemicum]ORV00521.1 flavin-nucleotide-binding protein [Mycobacterium bohemicum]CPR08217.1 flavin-nucleotide-binding protein [Mycobacterium bohemicum DSM 44277]
MDTAYQPTPRTTPTRYRERARYDRDTVHEILDQALVCHLGYVSGGRPVVLPTTHARLAETLYLHGSTGSGPMLAARAAPAGLPVCVTVTLLDGLVLARAAMHHSVNFRSVVVLGAARPVDEEAEKRRALGCLLDHIAPGRAADCRAPNARELAATGVLALDLREVSAKVRAGGPVDDPEDCALPHWAGVVPLRLTPGAPVPSADLDPGVPLPAYL